MMKKLFGKKSQEKKSDTRKVKTWEQKMHDVQKAAGKKAHDTRKAVGNAMDTMVTGTASVAVGALVGAVADDVINNGIIGAVALADKVYYKYTGTGTVNVKTLIGWKTMSDSKYLEKLSKGKTFREVRGNHWCNQHASEINAGADLAGKVGGIMTAAKTTQSLYNGMKMVNSWADDEIDSCVSSAESAKADEQHV